MLVRVIHGEVQKPSCTEGLIVDLVCLIAGEFPVADQIGVQRPRPERKVVAQTELVLRRGIAQQTDTFATINPHQVHAQLIEYRRIGFYIGDFGVVVVVADRAVPAHAVIELIAVVGHQVDAVGAGVGGVGEVTGTGVIDVAHAIVA